MSTDFNRRLRCSNCRKVLLAPIFLAAVAAGSGAGELPPLRAQSPAALANDQPAFPPLSPQTKTEIARAQRLITLMQVIEKPLQITATKSDMQELATKIGQVLPGKVVIEARQVTPNRFTLNTEMSAVRMLHAAAALSDAKVYVLDNRLLIATSEQLTSDERAEAKDWGESMEAGVGYWLASGPLREIALQTFSSAFLDWGRAHPNEKGQPPTKMSFKFAELNPEYRELAQAYQNERNRGAEGYTETPLALDTLLIFDHSQPDIYELEIKARSPQQSSVTQYQDEPAQ